MPRLLIAILFSIILAACGGSEPSHREPPISGGGSGTGGTGTGGGDDDGGDDSGSGRPGSGEVDNSFDNELKDGVWRVTGAGTELRYDRGGVLFQIERSGRVVVTDLDGAATAAITPGTRGRDSICIGTIAEVNGHPLGVAEMKWMESRDGTAWYRLTDAAGNCYVAVLPAQIIR